MQGEGRGCGGSTHHMLMRWQYAYANIPCPGLLWRFPLRHMAPRLPFRTGSPYNMEDFMSTSLPA